MFTTIERKQVLQKKLIEDISHMDADELLAVRSFIARMAGEKAQDEMTRLWDEGIINNEKIDAAVLDYKKIKK